MEKQSHSEGTTSHFSTLFVAYGHTTMNTPVLVRSPKLSMVGPGQYLDGSPPGNTWCCRLHHLFFFRLKRCKIRLLSVCYCFLFLLDAFLSRSFTSWPSIRLPFTNKPFLFCLTQLRTTTIGGASLLKLAKLTGTNSQSVNVSLLSILV